MCCCGDCILCLAGLAGLVGLATRASLRNNSYQQEQFPIIPVERIPSYYQDPTNPYLIYLFY